MTSVLAASQRPLQGELDDGQLLKEAIPRLSRVAVLWNPATPSHPKAIEQLKAVAPSLSIEPSFVTSRMPEEFAQAFLAVTREHAQALYVWMIRCSSLTA